MHKGDKEKNEEIITVKDQDWHYWNSGSKGATQLETRRVEQEMRAAKGLEDDINLELEVVDLRKPVER